MPNPEDLEGGFGDLCERFVDDAAVAVEGGAEGEAVTDLDAVADPGPPGLLFWKFCPNMLDRPPANGETAALVLFVRRFLACSAALAAAADYRSARISQKITEIRYDWTYCSCSIRCALIGTLSWSVE